MCIRDRLWAEKQDTIRDNLEFGRYNWRGGINPIQYMERILLESRQLTPTIMDRQLIKKIARHYSKEIEITVITRGINMIPNFESLIVEYTSINQRAGKEHSFGAMHERFNARSCEGTTYPSPHPHNKGFGARPQEWFDKKRESDGKRPFTRDNDRQQINTREFVSNKASTSAVGKVDNSKEKKINIPTGGDSRKRISRPTQ